MPQYVFADTTHQYIFTTRDYGHYFNKVKVSFKAKQISMHAKDEQIILAYDEDADRKPVSVPFKNRRANYIEYFKCKRFIVLVISRRDLVRLMARYCFTGTT